MNPPTLIPEWKKSPLMDSVCLWCQNKEGKVRLALPLLYLIFPFFSAFLPLILAALCWCRNSPGTSSIPQLKDHCFCSCLFLISVQDINFWLFTKLDNKNYNDGNNNKNSWKLLNHNFSLPTWIVAIFQAIFSFCFKHFKQFFCVHFFIQWPCS